MSKKIPKKLKIFSLKIHKGAGIKKKPKTFLSKGTKHKNNYMEGLNSKNKNIKSGGSSQLVFQNLNMTNVIEYDNRVRLMMITSMSQLISIAGSSMY